MFKEKETFDSYVKVISRELVAQFTADEMELFDELYAQFQRNPAKFKQKPFSNDPLEFGVNEFLATYTPVIISMVTVVLGKLSQIIIQTLQGETETVIQEKTKQVFQRVLHGKNTDPYQSEFMTFSTQELDALYKLGVQEGIAYGLSAKEAAKVMARLTQPILRLQEK